MKYILDTNIVVYLEQKKQHPERYKKILSHFERLTEEDELCITALSLYELSAGIAHQEMGEDLVKQYFEGLKHFFTVLPTSSDSALIFGMLRKSLISHLGMNKNTAKKHDLDFMISSIAIAENAVLISNDKIFSHVAECDSRFRVENWA